MELDGLTKEQLWRLLADAVHINVMYPTHKAYIRDIILKAQADISAEELSLKLNMPLGEAMIILDELSKN
jgi:hypothetical protein